MTAVASHQTEALHGGDRCPCPRLFVFGHRQLLMLRQCNRFSGDALESQIPFMQLQMTAVAPSLLRSDRSLQCTVVQAEVRPAAYRSGHSHPALNHPLKPVRR